jgi:virginiamycin B lyase
MSRIRRDAKKKIVMHTLSGISGTVEFTLGVDGNFWMGDNADNAVLKVSRKGKLLDKIGFPESNAGIFQVANGSDGNEWMVERNTGNVYKITPKGKTTVYPDAVGSGCLPLFDAPGPDGNVWFTTDFCGVGKVTPSGQVTLCTFPNYSDQTLAVATGPDGNVWYNLGFNGSPGYVGDVTTGCGALSQYEYASSTDGGIGLTSGPDGNVWFGSVNPNFVGKTTTQGGMTTYGTGGTPYGIASGPDGNLYFAQQSPDAIDQITTSGSITQYENGIPSGCAPLWIVIGSDDNVWFNCSDLGAIGELKL